MEDSRHLHCRYAGLLGLAVNLIWVCFASLTGNPISSYLILVPFALVGVGIVAVFVKRWKNLPSFDRETVGFVGQLNRFIYRGFLELFRQPYSLGFDLVMTISSGLFLGVLYYGRYYVPSISQQLDMKSCPQSWPEIVCQFISLPQNDPILGEATLCGLSLALAAISSSSSSSSSSYSFFLLLLFFLFFLLFFFFFFFPYLFLSLFHTFLFLFHILFLFFHLFLYPILLFL